ncbi:hypothetical protein ONS95_003586 [Cadophora gregata]|uniref:uncharacterized protein n=1 Tax=Cadophora gregata TaxID=51156 RepID=UPI0026DCBFE7|nr:uncharacterized protein ONS95_003586 [Cadophora gregata]KAK0106864.1 hypothetical protein ONS95_003586 [Cadophora gregata]KAK0116551.1 hypothetical protein ONS96_012409 [Cadophora gregata f. sp. sojae]
MSDNIEITPLEQHQRRTFQNFRRREQPRCLPPVLDSETTLIGSNGLRYAHSRPIYDHYSPFENSIIDKYRASWEVDWGLVKEHEHGDWVLVKWVTSRHPVYTVQQILSFATFILNDRMDRYPTTLDREKLLMWILRDIVRKYSVHDRVLYTLTRYDVGNRLQNIRGGSNTLD